jgi:hypothetical protein
MLFKGFSDPGQWRKRFALWPTTVGTHKDGTEVVAWLGWYEARYETRGLDQYMQLRPRPHQEGVTPKWRNLSFEAFASY